jgi:UDP-glucose 4-epimerase
VRGDLLDLKTLERAFVQYRFEAVLHFAGLIAAGESVQKPELYYRNNVLGTLNLLDCMRRHGVKKLVFSSTAAVYGTTDAEVIDESLPLRPDNPYGVSKVMIERMLPDFTRAAGLQWVILRYFNAAGADPEGDLGEAHDPETHLIPLVLRAIRTEGAVLKVFGTDYPTPDGTCIRDYVHVSDLADAHVLSLQYLEKFGENQIFNLGSERGYSVREVIDTARRITGKDVPTEDAPRRPGDPPRLVASAQKARELLGWRPANAQIERMMETAWTWEQTFHSN